MRQFMELQAVFALVILSARCLRTALGPVGKEEDAAAGRDAQGGQLFLPPVVERLRGLPLLPPHDGDRPQHDLGRRCGAPVRLVSRCGWREVLGNGRPRECEARGANRDGGERAGGGRGRHAVVWASAVGERDAELDPGASRAGPHRAARGPGPREEMGGRAQGDTLGHAGTGHRDAARVPQPGRLGDRRAGDVLGEPEILAGERGAPGLFRSPPGWLRFHLRSRREGRPSREDEIRPATVARRGRRVAHRRVFRDGVCSSAGPGY